MTLLAVALAALLGAQDASQQGSSPTPKPDISQRGSRGSTAGGEERTAAPGAGIESGDANGMAGGRTDEGPQGGTGIRGSATDRAESARARANDQARRKNKKGDLLRPADSPPQMNRDPKAMGSGAPNVPPDQQPQARGKRYGRRPSHGRTQSPHEAVGGSAPEGSAGKEKKP